MPGKPYQSILIRYEEEDLQPEKAAPAHDLRAYC